MKATYTKLGRSEARGTLHAVRDETLGGWDGAESFCGLRIGETLARTKNVHQPGCGACREAVGLGAVETRRSGLRFEQRVGSWAKVR